MELSTEEARLVAMYRAIKHFDNPVLVDGAEASDLADAIESVISLDALEDKYSRDEMKSLLLGFVAGIGAIKRQHLLSDVGYVHNEAAYYDDDDRTVSGGQTGGVVQGQLSGNPDYVTQTGIREDNKEVTESPQ